MAIETRYTRLELLGEGEYGIVYKAIDKVTKQTVAIKEIKIEDDNAGIPPTALREVGLLKLLSSSRYIVKLLNAYYHKVEEGKTTVSLVMEYFPTDLRDFMASAPSPLPANLIQKFMYQLCEGLAYCHGMVVLHRDLKPENLLVDTDKMDLKISDFGLGRPFALPAKSFTPEVVTPAYRCPELFMGSEEYFTGVDIWSVGCIFAEMSRGQLLFDGDSDVHFLERIFRLLGTPTEEELPGVSSLGMQYERQNLAAAVPSLGPDGVDLLSKMLVYKPNERISAKAALKHRYFDGLDRSLL